MSKPSSLNPQLSTALALVLAVLALGWALRYMVGHETPVGRIEGQILLADLHRPLAGVHIYLQPTGPNHGDRLMRRAVTNADGRFALVNVPEGEYDVTASTRAHAAKDASVSAMEGKTTNLTLYLTRNEAELEIKQHQRVFGTKEKTHLSVSGYVDSDKVLAVPPKPDTLRLRVFQTRLSNILKDQAAANALEEVARGTDQTSNLPAPLLHPKLAAPPKLLFTRNVTINTADREGFFYQKIDLPKLGLPSRTGLYLLDIHHADKNVCSWLLVTDTGLIVKRAKSQLVAFAADMQSGTPIAGSEVRTYRNGRVVGSGRTDARGVTQYSVPNVAESEVSDSTRIMTVALRGDDEAVVQRNAYNDEEKNSTYAVHAYTDRTVYRPGQRISFKGIARKRRDIDYKGAAGALDAPETNTGLRYTVPVGQPVDVEIRDKSGERILEQRYVTNAYGAFFGQVDLLKEAVTGVYTLVMKIGGTEHTEDIYVASYHKPEYAVTVTPDKKNYTRGETIRMTVEGKYFFGAPVAGAKVRYSVYSSPDWQSEYQADADASGEDEDWSGFHTFRADNYYGSTAKDGTVTLDENGKAIVEFPAEDPKQRRQAERARRHEKTSAKDAEAEDSSAAERGPQEEVYTLSATVIEGQNREVEATGEARVTRGAFRLIVTPDGYVAAPGQAMNVIVSAQDFDGKPVTNLPFSLETGFEHWQDDKYAYKRVTLQNGVTGGDGRMVLQVTPPRAGSLTLKARAYDAAKHLVLGRAGLWAASNQGGELTTTYNDLSLLTDKRHYNPGDTARVLLNTSHLGQTVLLTIEGEKVQRVITLPIRTRSTVVRVPIRAEYGPNVFLAACYVQNKHFAQSETPLRVLMPSSDVKVTVTADREENEKRRKGEEETKTNSPNILPRYAPEEKITFAIQTTDAAGKPVPCELSFGVVDEAIYALREDNPKAMQEAFYPRRSNQVSTSYSFAVEYLGDADKTEPKIETRKKFPDTAYWNPNLRTDAQGRATVAFNLPDNLTTWRATAIANTLDTKVGRGVDKVLVTKDFYVRLQTPRSLTQLDQSRVTAIVHNETGIAQTALVRLRTENLTASGDQTQTLTLPPGGNAEASWPVTASTYGEAKLKVTAWTPKEGTARQYTDGLETTLPIRPHGREDYKAFAGQLTAEHPETEVVRLDANAVPELSHVTIRLTPSVASSLSGSLDYLIGYPYGCVEQTLSRILPDLRVQQVLKQRGLILNEEETRRTRELPRMVREGLQRLYRFQHPTGAWGWWEHDPDDVWMTGYVLLGLAEAQADGYPISERVLKTGRDAGVKLLKRCKPGELPFLLYGLALAGERSEVAKWRQRLSLPGMSAENLAYVTLTDNLLGKGTETPAHLLDDKATSQDEMLHWQERDSENRNDLTATAMALRVILARNPSDKRIVPTLRWLMAKRADTYWGSTRDTSWVLSALADYLKTQPNYSAGGQVQVQLNGKAWQNVTLTENNLREKEIVLRVPATALRSDKNDITLARVGGNSPIFYAVQLRQTVSGNELPAISSGKLSITREYLRVAAKQAMDEPWKVRTEPTHNAMAAGDHIRVRLTLNVPRDMSYVLIEDPFPAGCEVSERGDAEEVTDWNYWWSSIDVRDDRIAFFARSLSSGQHVIEYNLRAQTPGTYRALPTLLQAMYAPEQKAETAETKVEIR